MTAIKYDCAQCEKGITKTGARCTRCMGIGYTYAPPLPPMEPIREAAPPVEAVTKGGIKIQDMWLHITPVFDEAMGRRFKLMRMKLQLDQAELGEKLGVSASVIGDLERGRIAVTKRPFTYARLVEVFETDAIFILLGRNPDRFNRDTIQTKYWLVKHNRPESDAERVKKRRGTY